MTTTNPHRHESADGTDYVCPVAGCTFGDTMPPLADEPSRPVSPVASDDLCMAFLQCTNRADGFLFHPILGAVLACYRCADTLGEMLRERCESCGALVNFYGAYYSTPCDGTPRTGALCGECQDNHVEHCGACESEIILTADNR